MMHLVLAICALCWLFLAYMGASGLYQVLKNRALRPDAAIAAALGLVALVPRLLLPYGPLNFADSDRLMLAWQPTLFWGGLSGHSYKFIGVPALLKPLTWVVDLDGLLRVGPALFGAAAVIGVYGVSRRMGFGRLAATAGALALCFAPPHQRYSTGFSFSVEGGAVWLAAFALALSPTATWRHVVALAAAAILGVYIRPELRLLLIPVGLLLLQSTAFDWRRRFTVAAIVFVALIPYLPVIFSPGDHPSFVLRLSILSDGILYPVRLATGVVVLGLVGLLARGPHARRRLALATGVILLLMVYVFAGGGEWNPSWGESRYLTNVLPLLAIGVAAFVARLKPSAHPFAVALIAVLSISSTAYCWKLLKLPTDQQAEYAFARASVPTVLRDAAVIYVQPIHHQRGDQAAATAMGIATAGARRLTSLGAWRPNAPGLSKDEHLFWGRVDVNTKWALLDDAFVFEGLATPPEFIEKLRQEVRLELVDEKVAEVSAETFFHSTCGRTGKNNGVRDVQPCRQTMRWYRVHPLD